VPEPRDNWPKPLPDAAVQKVLRDAISKRIGKQGFAFLFDRWIQEIRPMVGAHKSNTYLNRNGAGESTLLKILSRITKLTTDLVCIKGRVASLLEAGIGPRPELTGCENI
jgi:ABC-type uncharacterized transport system ATPase subunit